MFVVYPSNIDYMIDDVRLQIGDVDKEKFSDSLVRAALIGAIKMLQRRWKNRYLVFTTSFVVSPVPDGVTVDPGYIYVALPDGYAIIASGYSENDVIRSPYHTFVDPGTMPISQEDEWAIVLAASIILRTSYITSSADSFQSWSDGEFAFSNISSSKLLEGRLLADIAALDLYFKKRLARPIRSEVRDQYP